MGAHSPILPRLRHTIETEIEMHMQRVTLLIARLDRADAPFEDLEDDDPSGSLIDNGEASSDDGRELLAMLPAYAVDQTSGPTNERAANNARQAQLYGLVPNGRGGLR